MSSEEEELTVCNGRYREQLENEVEDIMMDVTELGGFKHSLVMTLTKATDLHFLLSLTFYCRVQS